MYAMLKGKVVDREDTKVMVDVHGVVYEVNVAHSLVFNKDEDIVLYIKTIVREDDISLYGFKTKEEKKVFSLLRSVSGVGAKTVLSILSYYSIQDVSSIIASQNVKLLSKVPGIGVKTAERLIVELKDKFEVYLNAYQEGGAYNDLLNALISLGFKQNKAELALKQKLEDIKNNKPLELILRETLQLLA